MKIVDLDLYRLSRSEFLAFINCLLCYFECQFATKYNLNEIKKDINFKI